MKIVYLVNLLFQNQNMLNFKQYLCSPFFKVFILLLYFCIVPSVFGQTQTDSLATKSYKELTQLYIKNINSKPATAIVYMTKAHEITKKDNDTTAIAKTLYGIALCNFHLTNNSKTLEGLDGAIAILLKQEKVNEALLSECYNLRGMSFSDMKEDSKALDSYLIAKKYANKNKNLRNIIKISTNIAFIKKAHKEYKEAIQIFKKNLEIVQKSAIHKEMKLKYQVSILANITEAYLRIKEVSSEDFTKEARYYNDIALQKCSKKESTLPYHELLINKTIILYRESKYSESIELAQEIVKFALENDNENLLCAAYFYIGKNYAKLKKYNQAITFLKKVESIIEKSQKKYYYERELNRELSLYYSTIGEIEIGQEYLEKYTAFVETEIKDDRKVLNAVYTKNDIPELKEEIERIKNGMLVEKSKKQQLYFITGILIVLLFVSIVWYRKKVKTIKLRVEEVLLKVNELEKTQAQEKNTGSTISEKVTDSKAALLLEKLQKFEEEKMYLHQDCSLSFVAEKLDSNTSYISNVINNYKNKTFKSYITELRINAALIRLKNDDKLRSYTIKAIAEEFGFKRQETFSKAFRAQTGIYPSQYLKKLRED